MLLQSVSINHQLSLQLTVCKLYEVHNRRHKSLHVCHKNLTHAAVIMKLYTVISDVHIYALSTTIRVTTPKKIQICRNNANSGLTPAS